MSQQSPDTQLILAFSAGDPLALEPVYDAYAQPVFALLLRIVKNKPIAEDLLQDTFVRAWQHAQTYDATKGTFLPWLLGIAHNLALNELRRQRRRPNEVSPQPDSAVEQAYEHVPSNEPDPVEEVWVRERRARLREALANLTSPEQRVIQLYALGYSQADIAQAINEPLGTVKSRMRRALLRLRDLSDIQGLDHD